MTSWANPKPAYVLLLGDGTFDYKYKDTSVPDGNFIPTQILFKDDPSFGYYASDSILAAVSGSDMTPDLVVGRISTRTDAETQAVLQKTLNYEQSPRPGTGCDTRSSSPTAGRTSTRTKSSSGAIRTPPAAIR
jgi:hypothetical protein